MVNERRRKYNIKKRTGRLIDRLTYCPAKDKQKFTRSMRRKLQLRKPAESDPAPQQISSLKFGSININGIDMEASWAVTEILKNRGYDVRINCQKNKNF